MCEHKVERVFWELNIFWPLKEKKLKMWKTVGEIQDLFSPKNLDSFIIRVQNATDPTAKKNICELIHPT